MEKIEICWLLIATIVIAGLSIYWGDNLMGIISATTGVACEVCTGKGKLSAYLFGLINCVLYAIIAYKATLYGETVLNVIYYIPMQFVGFFTWKKSINNSTASVKKRKMNFPQRITVLVLTAICTLVYDFVLRCLKDALPFIYLFNSVIVCVKWEREARKEAENEI